MFPLAAASSDKDIRDFDPLFASDEVLDVEIEGPFAFLVTERPDEEEVPAKFRLRTAAGDISEFDVVIRTRGKNRRNTDVCEFPPLRLNFRKAQTTNTLFDGQDKVKLVTHCRNDSRINEQAVLSEYLAYRILNILTDTSFRARLLRIKYLYANEQREVAAYGILIEHADRLGKRLHARPFAVERVAVRDVRPGDMNRASVFQFFLGNTDFSPIAAAPGEYCCHNQALFAPEAGLHYTVPYDFDRTGWVNAPYARPNPRFRIRSVRERLYRGRCVNNEHLDTSLQLFREHRDEIETLVKEQPDLTPATRRYLLNYSDAFYRIIENPRKRDKAIVKNCI
jgi:hypothetical protein